MSRTDQEIYKLIAGIVNRSAPEEWQKILVKASIEDDNGETLYDYFDASENMHWFAPDASKQYEVYLAFQELRAMMKVTGHSWGSASFTLERSGKFQMEFNYDK